MVETPHHVFAVYDGALLSYSLEDEEVVTYSFAEGLHDVRIKQLAYSADADVLVIVYENANIDLFLGENQVVNIASVKNDVSIPDKTVNSVTVVGKNAYLATAFGIVAVDLSRKEIKGTYKLGINTLSVSRWDDYFYAFTAEGIKRAAATANLLDKENWINFDGDPEGTNLATGGMTTPNDIINALKINSPANNQFYYIKHERNKLLAASGGRETATQPGMLMVYENKKWHHTDRYAIQAQTGMECKDFVSIAVDPRDDMHYFVSSWENGLYEFRDMDFVQHYSLWNSELQSATPGLPYENDFVWVDGLTYDRNNNLYMVNVEVEKGLVVLTADGRWLAFDYPELAHKRLNQILITKNNRKWININRSEYAGIFALDDKNTLENTADDKTYFGGQFVDQQGANVGASAYLCMAEDLNGLVWVGTNNGPISFSSAEQVGRGQCNRVVSMDENELNGYHLLEGQSITAIAVDGANRKWMGTSGSGVFLVDQTNGELHVENFNTDNSDILSNNITAIAIDGNSGEVYVATEQGLCSYRGDAIEGKANYSNIHAFPNPVYPARQSQVSVTGLMAQSTVKITDMAGNLIREGISNGGQFTWNCTDRNGNIVKAGIYLAFATNPDGSDGGVAKIMVIR
ncbi:hypothetical protein AGMMS49965_22470 [Bacteroidia bacterium]|nr:hypothetical protein AGMMS49965_22470 [Bacteroidia bacterium]